MEPHQIRKLELEGKWNCAAREWGYRQDSTNQKACQMIADSIRKGDEFRERVANECGEEPAREDSYNWVKWFKKMEQVYDDMFRPKRSVGVIVCGPSDIGRVETMLHDHALVLSDISPADALKHLVINEAAELPPINVEKLKSAIDITPMSPAVDLTIGDMHKPSKFLTNNGYKNKLPRSKKY